MVSKKKKNIIIIAAVLAAAAGLIAAWQLFFPDMFFNPGVADVEYVSVIAGLDGGITNRFAGVVEPQDTFAVRVDSSRRLRQTYVSKGDEVIEGTPLIEYETEDLELELERRRLDIMRIKNTITSYESQLTNLKKQRDNATGALQLEYTQQIQSYEANVKQEEYNLKLGELEIERLMDKIDDSVIYSPFDGVVQSLNEQMAFGGDENSPPYIVVNALGGYRVRGEISEMNVANLQIGAQVIIRSRLNRDSFWNGEIAKIDLLSPIIGVSGAYGFDANPTTLQSTKYPFYITVINYEGLVLGQHVYIEPNVAGMSRDGIWLLMYYIQVDDVGPFVWAVNRETDKLERRYVTVGDYDSSGRRYEVLTGLAPDDEIAWPSEELKSNMRVRRGSFSPSETQVPETQVPSSAPTDPAAAPSAVPSNESGSDHTSATATDIRPPATRPVSDSNLYTPARTDEEDVASEEDSDASPDDELLEIPE